MKKNPTLIYSEAIKSVSTLYNVTLFYSNGEIATLRNVTRNQIKTSGNVLDWSSRRMTSSTITKRQASAFAKKLRKVYRRAIDISRVQGMPYHVVEAYLNVAKYYGYVESNGTEWRQVSDDMRGVMDHVCDDYAAKIAEEKTPRTYDVVSYDNEGCLRLGRITTRHSEDEIIKQYAGVGLRADELIAY